MQALQRRHAITTQRMRTASRATAFPSTASSTGVALAMPELKYLLQLLWYRPVGH